MKKYLFLLLLIIGCEPLDVKPDGMVWPAGSACSRCLNGEMVCRPIFKTNKIQALRFAIDRIVTVLETDCL